MKNALCLLIFVCFILTSCVANGTSTASAYSIETSVSSQRMAPDDLPKPVEDPSIVGRYLYSHTAVHTSIYDYPDTTTEDELKHHFENHVQFIETQCALKSKELVLLEDGTYTYVQHYTREILKSGVYTYDGETLEMYDEEGYPFSLGIGWSWEPTRRNKLIDFDNGWDKCYFALIYEPTSSTQQ